ncbi:phosphoglycerate mutase [Neiella marina]|uniref:Phosphoglycerate mutase n=1 Tax=Neiella marina TaxID=508461 RepID=A0A8J2U3R7_9GAMM|nr:histidine phosphatase family protein [Neiella marina]GGA72404.1 phosphoglycerate mutase [Neiella marina]
MALYVVRHDETELTGCCYGQTDCNAKVPYEQTALRLQAALPQQPAVVVSSPLQRCRKLAETSYNKVPVIIEAAIAEVNFGDWEGQGWNDINRAELDRWAKTPTQFQFPNGESLEQFRMRVEGYYHQLWRKFDKQNVVVFTHAGVIRLWLALAANKSWETMLSCSVPYASVWCFEAATELSKASYQQIIK